MIKTQAPLAHWNYFLALESDLAELARYVEFCEANFKTHSIEMVRLLLTASSEVDVVMRQWCQRIGPDEQAANIEQYRNMIRPSEPAFETTTVRMPRFGLDSLEPWSNWTRDRSPLWWTAHNDVKHERNNHFGKANLKNTLNAVAGLYVLLLFYYRGYVEKDRLVPAPALFSGPDVIVKRAHSLGGETGLYYRKQP